MCGISGIMSFNGAAVSQHAITSFNDSLYHRGPDFGDVYFNNERTLALGHRRLSIIDLEDRANQPFVSEDGRLVITFNGEIYNYLELRAELIGYGYQFRTTSDTEVILKAYQEWGVACLSRFNGMWAFAIWDNASATLFAARDRFGVKPFYYVKEPERFAFASEQKAFAHLPSFDFSIEPGFVSTAIHNYGCYEAIRECLYKKVFKLLPGEYLQVNHQGSLNICKWWDLQSEIVNHEYSLQEAKQAFVDACEIRTRADVDIAFSLSGGMDSSSVACYSYPFIANSNRRSKAFIGSFPDTEFDEYHLAKEVVDQLGIESQRVLINEGTAIENMVPCLLQVEDILSSPPIGQWAVYEAMKKAGFKVSLEGHGGDELLGGYSNHVQAHLGDVLTDKKDAEELAATIALIDSMRAVVGYSNMTLPDLIRRSTLTRTSFRKSGMLSRYLPESNNDLSLPEGLKINEQQSLLHCNLMNDFCIFTLPAILRHYDKCSMGHSVEVRSPFLDWKFVMQAFQMPHELKINRGKTKTFLRRHLDKVPEIVRSSDVKLGFNVPMLKWFESASESLLQDIIHSTGFMQSNLFDGKALANDMTKFIQDKNWPMLLDYWKVINLHILDNQGV